jgi:3',5'-nucleoside bisphosphate phosphatase
MSTQLRPDEALSPREVVRLAARSGLRAIAITDHDSVAGIAEASEEGGAVGIEVIPGLELSARCHAATLHILGYYVRVDNPYFPKMPGRASPGTSGDGECDACGT